MANLYGTANHSSSTSQNDPDDFSLFLHQIMLRSSSSSSSSFMVQESKEGDRIRPSWGPPGNQDCGLQSLDVSGSERIPLPEVSSGGGLRWSSGGVLASPGTCFQEGGVNVSSSSVSVGTVDYDLNEYDCESEGFEGVMDEAIAKPTTGRNSSKRSRAAEVHNLSEKRRRSRINEKMRALQNLIPNSNKTDKASMLDEAIDYLKQLQLQVQLLTMRNGLSIYPMCLPGVVQTNQISEMRMSHEGNKSMDSCLASVLPVNPAAPSNLMFSPADDYTDHKQVSTANLPKLNDSEHSLAPESVVIHARQGAFEFQQPRSSNKGINMEGKVPCPQSEQEISLSNSLEDYMGSEAAGSSFNINARSSGVEEHSLDACVLARDKAAVGAFLSNQLDCGKAPISRGNG